MINRYRSHLCAMAFLLLPATVSPAAFPMGAADSGKIDLILCSSYWQDRAPCYIEWYQFNSDGSLFDSRTIRKSNETWTDATGGDLDGDGDPDLLVTLDNDKGFSAVYRFSMDRLGTVRCLTPLLPNEPWRHYSALSLGRFDDDTSPDVLTVNLDQNGKTVLEWFEFDARGTRLSEKTLLRLDKRCAEGVAFGRIDGTAKVTVFVLIPGTNDRDNCLARFQFDTSGKLLSSNRNWLRIPVSAGMITGLTLMDGPGPEGTGLLACAHRLRPGAAVTETLERGNRPTEAGFLLAASDTDADASRLLRIPIEANGSPGRWSVWVDWVSGRNWRGIARIKSLKAVSATFPVAPRSVNARPEILHLKGMMGDYYRIDEAVALVKGHLTKYGYLGLELKSGLTGSFANYEELLKYDMVILTDLPVWALDCRQIEMLRAYVRSGGRLAVFDGPMSGRNGGYRGSPLEELLPCEVGDFFSLSRLTRPFLLSPGRGGYVYYCSRIGKCRSDAVVKVQCVGNPLLLEHKLGLGTVHYFVGLPLGKDSGETAGFWNAEGWPGYLARELMSNWKGTNE